MVDEYRRTLREYKDYQGRTVLKRIVLSATSFLDTYYVYNAVGQLRAVLQPEFQTSKSPNHGFYYLYDARGNMTQKKIPGAATATMSYDSRDRLKTTTDGKGQVFSYEYEDNLNRLERIKLGTSLISQNHYDKYTSLPGTIGSAQHFKADVFPEWANLNTYYIKSKADSGKFINGLLTASDQYIFNASGALESSYLRTLYYYDKKGQLIQTVRQLYGLGNNAIERVSYLLDFSGKVLRERTDQSVNSSTIHLEKGFAYDHMDRLVKVMHRVWTGNKAPKQYTHSELTYNEVGQLKTKKLHGGLQTLTYKNHVRGWMGSIQQSQGKTFSLNLEYLSNGNIKTMAWNANNTSGSMALAYDAASRLTSATGSGGFNGYNENLTYDKNGNITTLKRHENTTLIDKLTYTYTGSGNRFNAVVDSSGSSEGFPLGTTTGMVYDSLGNLLEDKIRKITLSYNPLNLIAQAKKETQTLSYIYDAGGRKLQVLSPAATTTYAGAFEYDGSGNLKRIATEEGQIVMASDSFRVEYFLRDHLGNVRMVLGENNQVKQVTEYHAFGRAVFRNGSVDQNRYLYNGQEIQDQTGFLDYGARQYDPLIGRFMSLDPLGEANEDYSLYLYAANDPIGSIDLLGLTDVNGDGIDDGTLLREVTVRAKKNNTEANLDNIQLALDAVGVFPGAGTVAGIANAGIDVYRGNYWSAAGNLVTSVPGLGTIIKGTKLAVASTKVISSIAKSKAVKVALVKVIATYRNMPSIPGTQKHHLIPQALLKKYKTDFAGASFNIHDKYNIEYLDKGFHASHRAYNELVTQEINTLIRKNGTLTNNDIMSLTDKLRTAVNEAQNDWRHFGGPILNEAFRP